MKTNNSSLKSHLLKQLIDLKQQIALVAPNAATQFACPCMTPAFSACCSSSVES